MTPEQDIGKTFSDVNHNNVFLGPSSKAIQIKAKINKWDLMKFISFCTEKETIKKKTKRKLTEWEKIFANRTTDKGSKICKQLMQPNIRKQPNHKMG